MSWSFDPSGWTNGLTVPNVADYQHIATDLHTRGANVDGGGFGRANTTFITLVPGALPIPPAPGMLAVDAGKALQIYNGTAWNKLQSFPDEYDTRSYDWSQAPGGTLTSGISQAITLAPVPAGVNGADVGHMVYLSNGTGTAEATPILGGTAVAGSSTGTILVNPAHNHSGPWTVGSASAGIQEAFCALPPTDVGGVIRMPAASLTIYGTINIPLTANGACLRGASKTGTLLVAATSSLVFFTNTSTAGFQSWHFEDFALQAPSISAANTCVGFQFVQSNIVSWNRITSVNVHHLFEIDRGLYFSLKDIYTRGQSDGKFWDSTNSSGIGQVYLDGWHAQSVLSWDATEPVLYFGSTASNAIDHVYISFATNVRGGIFLDTHQEDISLSDIQIIGGSFCIFIKGVFFARLTSMDLSGSGAGFVACILMDSAHQVKITNCTMGATTGDLIRLTNGLAIQASEIIFADNNFAGNGQIGGAGTAILMIDPYNTVVIADNTFGSLSWAGKSTSISIPSTASNFSITGNAFLGEGQAVITTITNANPAVITLAAPAPNWATGGWIYFSGATLGTWVALNGNNYQIFKIDSTHFSFGVDTTGWTAYGANAATCAAMSFDITDATPSTAVKRISGNTHMCTALANGVVDTPVAAAKYLFSQLPAASVSEGLVAVVTDSTTAVWGAVIAGSGSNRVLAYCDGTSWTVAGK